MLTICGHQCCFRAKLSLLSLELSNFYRTVEAFETCKRPENLTLTVAHDTCEANNLAWVPGNGDVLEAFAGEVLYYEIWLDPWGHRAFLRKCRFKFATHNQGEKLFIANVRNHGSLAEFSIAQHSDSSCYFPHFGEAVCDVDDGRSGGNSFSNQAK